MSVENYLIKEQRTKARQQRQKANQDHGHVSNLAFVHLTGQDTAAASVHVLMPLILGLFNHEWQWMVERAWSLGICSVREQSVTVRRS